jgi:hypothetical protein
MTERDRPELTEASEASWRVVVTPQMVEAGVEKLCALQGEVGSEYLVREIFLAMASVSQGDDERNRYSGRS